MDLGEAGFGAVDVGRWVAGFATAGAFSGGADVVAFC